MPKTARRRASETVFLRKLALAICQAGLAAAEIADGVAVAVTVEALGGHPESEVVDVVATEVKVILAVEVFVQEVEVVPDRDREIEVKAHETRARGRSTEKRESQIAMAADPETEAIFMF